MRFSLSPIGAFTAVAIAALVAFGVLPLAIALHEEPRALLPVVVVPVGLALLLVGWAQSEPLAIRLTDRALVIERLGRDVVIPFAEVTSVEAGPVIEPGARTATGRLLFDPRVHTLGPHLIPIDGGSATLLASEVWGPTVLVRRRSAEALLLRAQPFAAFFDALRAAVTAQR